MLCLFVDVLRCPSFFSTISNLLVDAPTARCPFFAPPAVQKVGFLRGTVPPRTHGDVLRHRRYVACVCACVVVVLVASLVQPSRPHAHKKPKILSTSHLASWECSVACLLPPLYTSSSCTHPPTQATHNKAKRGVRDAPLLVRGRRRGRRLHPHSPCRRSAHPSGPAPLLALLPPTATRRRRKRPGSRRQKTPHATGPSTDPPTHPSSD